MARTETLVPVSDVSAGWEEPAGTSHAERLADSSDLTAISTLTSGVVDRVTLTKLPTDVTSVTSVTVRARVDSGDSAGEIRARLFDGLNLLTGPTWAAGASVAWATWAPALAPDGGAWTRAKVNALTADLEAVTVAFGELFARRLELAVVVEEADEIPNRPAFEVDLPDNHVLTFDVGGAIPEIAMPDIVTILDGPPVVPEVELAPRETPLDIEG